MMPLSWIFVEGLVWTKDEPQIWGCIMDGGLAQTGLGLVVMKVLVEIINDGLDTLRGTRNFSSPKSGRCPYCVVGQSNRV